MKQSTYLCVILHVKHKKLPILAFLTRFLIIGKIQGGGQDGDHASQASTTRKINLILWNTIAFNTVTLHLCRRDGIWEK